MNAQEDRHGIVMALRESVDFSIKTFAGLYSSVFNCCRRGMRYNLDHLYDSFMIQLSGNIFRA